MKTSAILSSAAAIVLTVLIFAPNAQAGTKLFGQDCAQTSDCESIYYCDQTFHKCANPQGDGQSCGNGDECLSKICTASICVAPLGEGGTCHNTRECATTLFCNEADRCVPKRPGGEPCMDKLECVSNRCILIGDEKKCAAGAGQANSACATQPECETGLYCDMDGDKKCHPKLPGDSACTAVKAYACKSYICQDGKCTIDQSEFKSSYGLPDFLATDDPSVVIARVIKIITGLVGTIALLLFVYGGIRWLTSAGNPDGVTAGKNTMVWSAIGMAVIFSSYIMVNFVFNLFGK